ncbi:MAG: transporter substrate-binding domain-containing protein, partial [Alphaproteobacteria bacterium]|nr:transporter substrate-binding domain-containing protein [Alphaproteobacteria bacterium]
MRYISLTRTKVTLRLSAIPAPAKPNKAPATTASARRSFRKIAPHEDISEDLSLAANGKTYRGPLLCAKLHVSSFFRRALVLWLDCFRRNGEDSVPRFSLSRWLGLALLATVLFPLAINPSSAQTPAPAQNGTAASGEIHVMTRVLPPMVIRQNDQFTGFSIDLWNEIASRLKLNFTYEAAPDVRAQLEAVRSGKAQVGVAAISITSAREAEFDFSQPILNAGLQIMVSGKGREAGGNPLMDLLSLLFSWTSLAWLGIAILLVLVPAHIVWFFERRHDGGIIPSTSYIPGIFYALYWAASTLATQAESAPKQW